MILNKVLFCTGVLDLADSYCEVDLKNKCERLICQRVTVDNIVTLYAVANKYKTQVYIAMHSRSRA